MSMFSGTTTVKAATLRKGQFIVGKGHIVEVTIHYDTVANTYGAKQPRKEKRYDHAGYQSAIAYEDKVQYKPAATGRVTIKGNGYQMTVPTEQDITIFVQPTTPILTPADAIVAEIDTYRKNAA